MKSRLSSEIFSTLSKVPLFSKIFYLVVPKIEICLKQFLDKKIPKSAIVPRKKRNQRSPKGPSTLDGDRAFLYCSKKRSAGKEKTCYLIVLSSNFTFGIFSKLFPKLILELEIIMFYLVSYVEELHRFCLVHLVCKIKLSRIQNCFSWYCYY